VTRFRKTILSPTHHVCLLFIKSTKCNSCASPKINANSAISHSELRPQTQCANCLCLYKHKCVDRNCITQTPFTNLIYNRSLCEDNAALIWWSQRARASGGRPYLAPLNIRDALTSQMQLDDVRPALIWVHLLVFVCAARERIN
jgi:hypothetical protein